MEQHLVLKLIELFPHISEEFISGIYDAHKDEEVTIEELIDVILSFEFPPLRESSNEHSLLDTSNANCNGPATDIELKSHSEVPSVIDSSTVQKRVKNEVLQKLAPEVSGYWPSEGKMSSLESSHEVKLSSSKDLTDEVLCEGNKNDNDCCTLNISEVKIEPNFDKEVQESENPDNKRCNEVLKPVNEMEKSSCSLNREQFNEEEEDSSPECSIRYLMKEENVGERSSIAANIKELFEITEENRELASAKSKLSSHLSLQAFGASSDFRSSNNKSSSTKQKKVYRCQKRICSDLFQVGSSQTLSHCSTKKVGVRSCKMKTEEERLRRRLINQSRHFHKINNKKMVPITCSSQFLDIDKKYYLLCQIFTDADPNYLLSHCEFLTDQEKILDFISQSLEFRDYPKVTVFKEEPRLMDRFQCTIEEFIEGIPDPDREFSSVNYVRTGYEENAEIYLKARYQGLSDEEAKEQLKTSSYNLTSVCKQLEEEGWIPTLGVLDFTPLHHPANIFFHQEVWYIEHRKEVLDYIKSGLEAIRIQEELDRPPTPPEEVFECEICRDDVTEYNNLGTCDGQTGHLFCIDCIRKSAEIRINEGETTFPCLVNCGSFIPLQTIEELIPRNIFNKLMGRIQEEEIRKANIAGVESCPFCPYAYGPGEESVFTCLNPECMKLSCRICRKEEHSTELCDIFKNEDEERARLIIENKMSEALMRTCHSCGKSFIKSDGCNKMECTCGAKMCYVCRQPVQDYSHFNGPGGDNTARCPLFSQDDELHVLPVQATAQQVFNEIAASNPQLNLDRAKLIPN